MKRIILLFFLFAMVISPVFSWDDTIPNALFTRQFHISHGDLTDSDTSQTIALFTIPAGARVVDVWAYVSTAMSGGSVSAVTMAVGDSDVDGLAEEHDVLGTGNAVWILEGQNATDKGDILYDDTIHMRAKIYTSATAINAIFTSTSDNLVNLTAGDLDIFILYSEPR